MIEDYEKEAFPRALTFKERLKTNLWDIIGGIAIALIAVALISGLWIATP